MDYKDLTPEQKDKARACKTQEELQTLAQEKGYDLADEELEAVSGAATCYERTPDNEY